MRNMRAPKIKGWWIAVACVVVAAVAARVALRPPDKTWAQVQRSGVIRFGVDPNYWPFEGLTVSGEFAGIDIDLAREIARRWGLGAELVIVGSDGFNDALLAGRCDAIISGLIPDTKRTLDVAYTTPYFDAGLVFIEPAASATHIGDNLTGRTIAVEFGSDGDARARWLARRTVGLQVLARETLTETLQAVEARLADAALTDTASARRQVTLRPALRIGERQTSIPYVIAVRADAHDLLAALNKALAQIESDGKLESILAQWLDHG